jgi:hypothetical protein
VAELADALDSKSSTRKSVWVRPPPSVPSKSMTSVVTAIIKWPLWPFYRSRMGWPLIDSEATRPVRKLSKNSRMMNFIGILDRVFFMRAQTRGTILVSTDKKFLKNAAAT